MEINEIDTTTKEGKMLIAACAILTTSPNLIILKEPRMGTEMTPMEVLDCVKELAQQIYEQPIN